MKRYAIGLLFVCVAVAAPGEPGTFSSTVSPAEASAAGLQRLSPAQLAELDRLVEKYKSGELEAARRAADEAMTAKRAAEAQAAKAEATAAAARVERAQAQSKPASHGLFDRAKGLLVSSGHKDDVVAESTVVGKFRGWQPRQVFLLANGQRWQIANDDRYFTRPVENPKVVIRRAAISGFWMRFPDLSAEVRVNLLSE
ncbi:MAG TPA: hypothetical protein VHE61_17580 [Opitutaceae bacterium]|nr:hypothetical protein [Opitutaceae bacterium]